MAKLIPIPFEEIEEQVRMASPRNKALYSKVKNQLGRVVFSRVFQERVLYIRSHMLGQKPSGITNSSFPLHGEGYTFEGAINDLCSEMKLDLRLTKFIAHFIETGKFDFGKWIQQVFNIGPEFQVIAENHGVSLVCGERKDSKSSPFIVDPELEFLLRLSPSATTIEVTEMFEKAKKVMRETFEKRIVPKKSAKKTKNKSSKNFSVSRADQKAWPFELINEVRWLRNEQKLSSDETAQEINKRYKKSYGYSEINDICKEGKRLGY